VADIVISENSPSKLEAAIADVAAQIMRPDKPGKIQPRL
jgi:hypothetical protein